MTNDISNFMQSFIDLFLFMLNKIFNLLSSIQFFGFSLLTYFIALFVLLAVVPLIIAIVNTQSTRASGKSGIILDKARSKVEKRIDSLGIGVYDADE